LKNITIHEINKSWIVRISIEALKGLEYGKMQSPFTSWPVKYYPAFHSSLKKWLLIPLMQPIAYQGTYQKVIVGAA